MPEPIPAPDATQAATAETVSEADARTRRSLAPLKILLPYLARYRAMVAATLIALLLAAGATLAVPMGVRRMIDFGFGGADGSLIDRYFAMMMLIGLVLALASAARFYCVSWLGERLVADLRQDVFAHLSRLSPAFYERSRSGELLSRLTADTTQIKVAVATAISQTLRNLVLFLGAVVMMLVTSLELTGLMLVAIPVIVLPLVAFGRRVRQLSRTAQDSLAAASAFAGEALQAMRVLQANSYEGTATARFASAAELAFAAARQRLWARALLTGIVIFLVFASVVGILWYGASAVLTGSLTSGRLSQFVLYAVFAAAALGELSEVYGEIAQAAGAVERLGEIMHSQPEIRSPAQPQALPAPAKGAIAFRNVGFAYRGNSGPLVLDDVTFEVAPGETVAIVGPSGSGKTTIFNLILRFYDPDRGEVRIDGVDVRSADLTELRSRVALVPQDVALFADSIAGNIRIGRPEASIEAVKRAAIAAQAAEFVDRLPQGYDSLVGERGVTLSGGQRQRLAIARAILRDAPILLLDEATSALDAESESLVQRALEQAAAGRTTLVIAHRLATVQRARRILVMDGGRLVAEGTHAELIAAGGLYARLAELQFGNGRGGA